MQLIRLYSYLFCAFIANASNLFACNTSEHHSVLNHYNHAQKIFEGTVIKVGKVHQKKYSFEEKATGIRSVFIQFEVIRNYKNTSYKEVLKIGLMPGNYVDFKIGNQYLIYANAAIAYDFLICEKGVALTDKEAIKAHQFLFQIPPKHSGYIVEYSRFGKKWAEGILQNGLPIGEWRYYAKSGELQIKGHYEKGEEKGIWEYFYHTNDESYCILNQIITGEYYQKTGTYQVLQLDSLELGTFNYQVTYLVGEDTLVESFYYKNQSKSKVVAYQNGWRHGEEMRFDEKGSGISSYQFRKDCLEGAFWDLQALRGAENRFLRVEGYYKADEKYDERHLYYENGILSQTKEILKEGKLL